MPTDLKLPRFYPILDTTLAADRGCVVLETAELLLDAGVKILQYRHKSIWRQQDYDEASRVAELCRSARVPFVINDRVDFAQLLGAGLHIGQDDVPPVAARRILAERTIGFSTHNRRQLTFAEEEPVEYLSLGPIFGTTSKVKPDPVVGIDGLRTLRRLTKKPLVAIGGINLGNAASVFEAGADSVAVISGVSPDNVREWLTITG